MLNTFQKTTQSGKPVVNKQTKLPEFTRCINQRMKAVCKELGIQTKYVNNKLVPQYSHEQRWDMIRNTMPQLT